MLIRNQLNPADTIEIRECSESRQSDPAHLDFDVLMSAATFVIVSLAIAASMALATHYLADAVAEVGRLTIWDFSELPSSLPLVPSRQEHLPMARPIKNVAPSHYSWTFFMGRAIASISPMESTECTR